VPRGIPPPRPSEEGASPPALLPPWGWRTYTPVTVEGDRFIVRTPCHRRPVRLDRTTSEEVGLVVRCPYCSRLWELRVAEIDGVGLSAVWIA